MSLLPGFVHMDQFPVFAGVAALKATLLLAAIGVVTLALHRRSAALRHLLWSLGMVGVIALPLVAALSPVQLPIFPALRMSAAPAAVGDERPQVTRTPRVPEAADSNWTGPAPLTDVAPVHAADGQPAWQPSWGQALVMLWLAGVLLLLGRFALGMRTLFGVQRRAEPMGNPGWLSAAARIARAHGVRRYQLRISDAVSMPFATGMFNPVIVVPTDAWSWSPERRDAVLSHELAHLSRGDLTMNALCQVARALYWFNPLAWVAAHRVRIESERACDDAVLRAGARASDYADHLLSIARTVGRPLPAAALAMARRSAFEGRLLAILEPGVERTAPSRPRVALATAALLLVILPLAAASPAARAEAMIPPPAETLGAPAVAAVAPVAAAATQQAPPVAPVANLPRQQAATPVAALIDALGDANASVRLAAASSLGSLEDPRAIAALAKALREDADPRVREAAASALGDIDDPRAVPALLEALKSERVSAVRERIVHALQEIDDPAAVSGVVAVTQDSSVAVRRAAAAALGEFEDVAALPALIAMARDSDIEVRRHVADALGNMENPSAMGALVTLSRDADAEVRASAVNALGNLEDARTMGALLAALKDANADVRRQAADAIHNVPDLRSAPGALIEAMADPDREVRQNVAHALGSIGDDAAVPALKRALSDTNADVRRAVAEALSDIGGADAITALMGLLKDADPEVRRIAAEALGKRR